MPQLSWKNGKDMGIILDDDTQSITLFSKNTSILIDGETGKIVTQGSNVENNAGDKKEDLLLQKTSGIESIIPSTITTPIPQSKLSVPIQYIGGLASDVFNMMKTLVGG